MKTPLLFLMLAVNCSFAVEPLIVLTPKSKEGEEYDYGEQLIEKFNLLLEKDSLLKEQFEELESAPKERAGGRYGGFSQSSFILHRSEDFNFGRQGSFSNYRQTVVIHYAFDEGGRKSMMSTTGVFAIFHLTGKKMYNYSEKTEKWEILTHEVSAKFKEFSKTLNADEKPGEDK